jgi:membrane protein implicated in regulation of membrane protease activity
VALGSEDRSTYSALRAARGTGHGFYLGMLLILAPITLLWWLVGLAPAAQGQGLGAWLGYFVSALAVFLTLIVATTYLTRLYLRRQDATPV